LAADSASKKAQRDYIVIMGIDLLLMLVAAAISTYDYQTSDAREILYVLSGIFLLTSLILSIILLTQKYEDTWYQGRALAESCKTVCWRFMTKSEFFEDSILLSEVKQRFLNRTAALSHEFSELNKVLDSKLLNKPVITDHMLNVRAQSLPDRKAYYIANRIENQKKWYSDKAELNKKRYKRWFFVIIATQAASLISAVYLIRNAGSNWNFIGLFTTVSAAAISWLQLKRHQELKQAYTTASQELNFIVSLSDEIESESDFSKFVLDSENAISREHTLWLAQRRK
ncbi:MAG TPA: DUF4231 domain-containing protein, partial [Chryseobacterium sp.]